MCCKGSVCSNGLYKNKSMDCSYVCSRTDNSYHNGVSTLHFFRRIYFHTLRRGLHFSISPSNQRICSTSALSSYAQSNYSTNLHTLFFMCNCLTLSSVYMLVSGETYSFSEISHNFSFDVLSSLYGKSIYANGRYDSASR